MRQGGKTILADVTIPAPKLGERISFTPTAFIDVHEKPKRTAVAHTVTGRIEYVNASHRYCRVAFTVNGVPLAECFKF